MSYKLFFVQDFAYYFIHFSRDISPEAVFTFQFQNFLLDGADGFFFFGDAHLAGLVQFLFGGIVFTGVLQADGFLNQFFTIGFLLPFSFFGLFLGFFRLTFGFLVRTLLGENGFFLLLAFER